MLAAIHDGYRGLARKILTTFRRRLSQMRTGMSAQSVSAGESDCPDHTRRDILSLATAAIADASLLGAGGIGIGIAADGDPVLTDAQVRRWFDPNITLG